MSVTLPEPVRAWTHRLLVVLGASVLTVGIFMLLPILEAISAPSEDVIRLDGGPDIVDEPPPPPEQEQRQDEPPPEDPEPPQLENQPQPLDLSQLEAALNPGFGSGDGFGGGDFAALSLQSSAASAALVESVFSDSGVEQEPRVVYQPGPSMTPELRKKVPASVSLRFIVNDQGRVENPVVNVSTNPLFDKAAIAALKQWKFTPGKRNGKAVPWRLTVTITFPQG